jgi:hypothetical protein
MFLSILLLLTILFAFASGVVLGRWVIFGILHFFDPARTQKKVAAVSTLAPAISGD